MLDLFYFIKKLNVVAKQLFALWQEDAETLIAELASKVSLLFTPGWRRVQQLK